MDQSGWILKGLLLETLSVGCEGRVCSLCNLGVYVFYVSGKFFVVFYWIVPDVFIGLVVALKCFQP